eukprot:Tamp_04372.p2 GENE.Tamp_04372~~Tamp_04372.p2  ORF type:complete len:378 (-),score=80.45 Tamp_04372:2183-3259(-)
MERPGGAGGAPRSEFPAASARSKSSHSVESSGDGAKQSRKPAFPTIRLEDPDVAKMAKAAASAMAQADPTRRDEATKALRELDQMAKKINDHRGKQGAVKEASTAYKQMMRGRYEYLNDFMEEMQQEPEELKQMTKRQELRMMHKMKMQADSTKYIVGSFVGGTALCAGVFFASWLYTKRSLNVKDTSEYAQKMRELTPNTKDELRAGVIGTTVDSFKASTMQWLESNDAFRRFKRTMRAGFGDLQTDIIRRASAGPDARFLNRAVSAGVTELKSRISGRSISGGRPLVADAIVAKLEAEEAAKRNGSQGGDAAQGGFSLLAWGRSVAAGLRLNAPPLEHEPPLDSIAFKKQNSGEKK